MLDGLAGEGVFGVTAEDGLAAVEGGQVVDGQGRVAVEGVASCADVLGALLGARGGLDGDGGAVHVVLLGSRLLGCPGPRVAIGSSRHIGRDRDVVGCGAGSVLGRATALDGQDNRPAGGCARLHVGRQGDLARTTSVYGRALEAHGDRLASRGRV